VIGVQIELSDDLANSVRSKAIQAGFDSVEANLRYLVDQQEPETDQTTAVPYERWREQYWAFVGRQISRNPNFDDSRESIYLEP
jgi:hypothetical protein